MSHSGILFKIQVARMCLMNFTGLSLLMQKWQTMTLYIDHLVIYTYSYFQSLVQMRLSSARGQAHPCRVVPMALQPWPGVWGLGVLGVCLSLVPEQTGLPPENHSAASVVMLSLILHEEIPFCHLFKSTCAILSLKIRNTSQDWRLPEVSAEGTVWIWS